MGQAIAILAAEDERVEIYYASEMEARMGAPRLASADDDFQLVPGLFNIEDFEPTIPFGIKAPSKLIILFIYTHPYIHREQSNYYCAERFGLATQWGGDGRSGFTFWVGALRVSVRAHGVRFGMRKVKRVSSSEDATSTAPPWPRAISEVM